MRLLLPHLAGVAVEEVEEVSGVVCIRPSALAGAVACRCCGCDATRVHSRYERNPADAPVGGRRLLIRLRPLGAGRHSPIDHDDQGYAELRWILGDHHRNPVS
ncbi:transposase family protein [Nocardia rhamnosiphila]|uniref:transposase family protein n=1 Tax=Nocardia rhamnosiphila TaxID=426716 RepID=UPI0034060E6B